jgi:hypothetical protein
VQDGEVIGDFVDDLKRRDRARGLIRSRSAAAIVQGSEGVLPIQTKWIMKPNGANAVERVHNICSNTPSGEDLQQGNIGAGAAAAAAVTPPINPSPGRRERGLKRWNTCG